MFDRFLDSYPLLACAVGIAVILLAGEFGWCLGRSRRRRDPDAMSAEVSALQASALGLLALIMGFTFSMAVSRLDLRVRQVVTEANAIGTTALRAEFLPDPHTAEVRKLLRDYVRLRVDLVRERPDSVAVDAAATQSNVIQRALWAQAKEAIAQAPQSHAVALFVQSLNETIDLQTLRVFASRNHVPDVVIILLYAVAMTALAYSGYAAALEGKQGRLIYSIMAVLVGCVIGVTIDIDRPQSGFVVISQAPLQQLLPALEK